ncbi:MAG: hypothetical protein U0Q07_02245 [Acidimicrobiales bacterium]
MTRRLSAAALAAALILSFAACSKKDDTGTTTATTAAPSSSTTEKKTESTEKSSSDTTEKKSTGTTQKRSTSGTSKPSTSGATGSMKSKGFELTSAQEQCINDQATQAGSDDPSLASNDAKLAGVIGGILVNCVPKPKLADGILIDIKNNPLTANLSSSQESCLRDEIIAANDTDLAIFVGIVLYGSQTGDQTLVKPFEDALNSACGTNISLDI